MKDSKEGGSPAASFVTGAVALLFLIIGYQAALFITKASVARIVANHDKPDTVYVVVPSDSEAGLASPDCSHPRLVRGRGPSRWRERENSFSRPLREMGGAERSEESGLPGPASESKEKVSSESELDKAARAIWRANAPRSRESFRFDPNTVSVDDLVRLGFTPKQAQSIDNYREKGGRFRRKSDFARSYVVEDSVYRRLEKWIDIPKIDLNEADSVAFETLPGIGPFFASRMVSYRDELGGYSYPEQLMDIWRFDEEKLEGLKDLICLSPPEPYPLWTLPEKDLAAHPYIGKRAARGIVLFRENSPREEWTVGNIIKAGILDPGLDEKLSRCVIAPPPNP